MYIKETYNDFFQKESGIVIDDAYDLSKKNAYYKYIEENAIKFVHSQDNDISNLLYFPLIEYISIPRDAYNIECLYQLIHIKGIRIYVSLFNKLDVSRFKYLEKLDLVFDEKLKNELPNVRHLKLEVYSYEPDLCCVHNAQSLKELYLESFKKIDRLENINEELVSLSLDYCLKLKDISSIVKCKNLERLCIIDCNKIEGLYECLGECKSIKELKLYSKETNKINHLKSLNFIEKTPIKQFKTDYIIDDNDLTPLKKLDDVIILRWKNEYNLSDKELPHISVLFSLDNGSVVLKKVDEIDGGINNLNIIWNDNNKKMCNY